MKVAAEAERLKREGIDVVDFGAGEPDFPTPDNVKQAAVGAIAANFTKYTSSAGTLELREAICARHAADFGTRYQPTECVVAVGGKQAIFDVMQVLLNRGDEVVIPVPYWVTYKDVVNYAGGRCVFAETSERDGFQITAAMIEPLLSNRTRIVVINSPSNPSGAVIDAEEFERIYALTSKRGIYLLTDECYCRFVYSGTPYSIAGAPGAKQSVLVAGSASKTYAMTGWRVGWVLGPEPVVAAIVKLQSQSTSNVTSIAQKAAVEALRGPQDSVDVMLAEYRRRRDFVVGSLRKIPGVTCAEPHGAFYAFPNVSAALREDGIRNTLEFCQRLLGREHVAVVPGEAFGSPGYIRISYATSMHELERGLARIHRFITDQAR
ncbi:MAG: pyridoxal phosphate-dependent aminotransferase [Acidobacteriota bacterium]